MAQLGRAAAEVGRRESDPARCARGLAWALFAFLSLSLTPAWAADRVVLGHSQLVPLADRSEPAITQTLAILRSKAASAGTTRVIVGTRVPFAAEGRMSAGDVTKQRNEIAAAHSALLGKVPALGHRPETIKRFTTIPFMALEVTAAELEQLAALTDVTSIEEDRLSAPDLAQSVPVIGGPTAWASGYTGLGQTVAILDTGVDKVHPFLSGKVQSEACYSTTSALGGATSICPGGVAASTASGSAMPYASGVCPAGACDHGTHVAGIAAGNGASLPGVGYSGVAKDASIIAIQVFSKLTGAACGAATACAMSYDSDQIKALERVYALRTTYNIAAVNMSLGGGSYSSQSVCDLASSSQKAAIDNLRAVKIATVISSGNSGYSSSMGSPGCISSAVSVGATWDAAGSSNSCAGNSLGTSSVDAVACYSNSAWFLTLLAPGSLITSSTPSNTYGSWQGTSMAAPHVAGAWALLKQKAPTATVDEVLAALGSSGVPVLDPRNGLTKPRINLPAALSALVTGVSYPLTVSKAGAGTGSVTSSPTGIDCGATCSASFASGLAVTLMATPTGSGIFTGWSGACSGTGNCSVTMSAAQSVTATFAAGTLVTPINQGVSGATGSNQYFSVAVPAGASNLVIRTSGGTGDIDLYVRASSLPTTSVYDCASTSSTNNEVCTFLAPSAATYNILLQGYAAFSGATLSVTYTMPAAANPGVLAFVAPSMTVMENAGNALVTVARTGGSDGAASVAYGTSAGTALAGVDYTTSVGNLNWPAGDASSRTITVPIINNAGVNPSPRSFSVNLSGVSGSTLGSPGTVVVNIIDDEAGAATSDLVYTPLTPCRIVDTRLPASAILGPNSGRDFGVVSSDYSAQGGQVGSCGVPAGVSAVVVNVVSTGQSGLGHLKVAETGASLPSAAFLNYQPGVNTANAGIAKVASASSTQGLYIYSANSASHAVVDITGYFTKPGSSQAVAVEGGGALDLAASKTVCQSAPFTPVQNWLARPSGAISLLANASALGFSASFKYSTDAGTNWSYAAAGNLQRGGAAPASWGYAATNPADSLQLVAGTTYIFAIEVVRVSGSGNAAGSQCSLQVTLE